MSIEFCAIMKKRILENMGEHKFLLPPNQQKFYYAFATALNILGLGKRTWWGYPPIHRLLHLHGKFIEVAAPTCVVTQILYLYVYYNHLTFDVTGVVLCILPVSVLVNINLISSKLSCYKKVMQSFMTEIHISNYFNGSNDYMKQKLLTVEQFTRYTLYYLIIFFGFNWFSWINIPVIYNVMNKEKIFNRTMRLQTCIYLLMPFDYGYSYKNWMVVHLINVYTVCVGVSIMATVHCINYMFIYHLIGHIQILKNTINTNFVGDVTDEEVKRRLVGIIKHHAFIIRVFDDVQSAFGVNVAANYLHNLFSDSLILYQILNGGDILMYGAMVGAYMGELILMSFVIEEIRRQSDELPEVVYSIPWESMSISNQKLFGLLLLRIQSEMQFIALGGLRAGVRPMVSILKTTFSYYVMLKSSIEADANHY